MLRRGSSSKLLEEQDCPRWGVLQQRNPFTLWFISDDFLSDRTKFGTLQVLCWNQWFKRKERLSYWTNLFRPEQELPNRPIYLYKTVVGSPLHLSSVQNSTSRERLSAQMSTQRVSFQRELQSTGFKWPMGIINKTTLILT